MDAGTAITVVKCLENHPTILGESIGFWCQNIILLVAAFLAYFAIRNSRVIERKKAAAEIIFSTRKDGELIASIHKISEIHISTTNIATYARNENNSTPEAQSIRYALNHYEYIAVGIAQGIYDEGIFKHSHCNTMIKMYDHTKAYIVERRDVVGVKTIYQDFECLACRWKEDPLKHKPIKSIPA